eukprot:TRINITY_DN2440_c0_g1_i2.p1 TRINITY_DN2440_c0_g1~~TRINITY_DN2440_c0_g1_i2.p1  ORF type:complete len:398 (+),score=97.89 TRINITY_DN2440_c0_g1_i2:50-1195(+)
MYLLGVNRGTEGAPLLNVEHQKSKIEPKRYERSFVKSCWFWTLLLFIIIIIIVIYPFILIGLATSTPNIVSYPPSEVMGININIDVGSVTVSSSPEVSEISFDFSVRSYMLHPPFPLFDDGIITFPECKTYWSICDVTLNIILPYHYQFSIENFNITVNRPYGYFNPFIPVLSAFVSAEAIKFDYLETYDGRIDYVNVDLGAGEISVLNSGSDKLHVTGGLSVARIRNHEGNLTIENTNAHVIVSKFIGDVFRLHNVQGKCEINEAIVSRLDVRTSAAVSFTSLMSNDSFFDVGSDLFIKNYFKGNLTASGRGLIQVVISSQFSGHINLKGDDIIVDDHYKRIVIEKQDDDILIGKLSNRVEPVYEGNVLISSPSIKFYCE